MKTLSVALAVALAVTAGSKLYARDTKSGNGGGDQPGGQFETMHDLNLTDEQEAKIADIRKESRPKIEEAAKELSGVVREEIAKVRDVLTPEQREKVQAMKGLRREHRAEGVAAAVAHVDELDLTDAEMTQIAEIRKEFRPKIVQALEGLKGVLSDEQRKAREEALKAGKSRREVLSSLNLTDEQKQKMRTVCQEVRSLVRDEMDKIRGVLSEEQQQKLTELRDERRERARDRVASAVANFRDLNLTDEQKAKIAEIRQEFRPKVHEAGNKLRAAVREELGMILDVIRG
jgi:Spy/CpxP family protein refolding chaperone